MRLGVRGGRAHERAAQPVVQVGRDLPLQIGVEEQPIAPGGHGFGGRAHQQVRIGPLCLGPHDLAPAQRVAIPAVGRGAGLGRAARVPQAAHHMAIGHQQRREDGAVGDRADAPGGGQLERRLAGTNRAGGVHLHDRVGRAGDDLGFRRQSGVRERLRTHRAQHALRIDDARHHVLRQAAQAQQLRVPLVRARVEQHEAHGLDRVGHKVAGQAIAHVVLHRQHPADARVVFRLVRLQPHQLRQRPQRGGRIEGALDDHFAIPFLQEGRLFPGALVRPVDSRANHPVVFVQQHRRVGRAVQAQRRDVRRLHLRLFQQLAHVVHERAVGIVRILLGPAGARIRGGIFVRGGRGDRAVLAQQRRLGRAAAEVAPQQILHQVTLLYAGGYAGKAAFLPGSARTHMLPPDKAQSARERRQIGQQRPPDFSRKTLAASL